MGKYDYYKVEYCNNVFFRIIIPAAHTGWAMWIFPAVTASLTGTVILCLVYMYLYSQEKELFLRTWAYSWIIYGLRFIFVLVGITFQIKSLSVLVLFAVIISSVLLLQGTYQFLKREMPIWWFISAGVVCFWALISTGLLLPAWAGLLPVYLFAGTANIQTGAAFLQHRKASSPERLLIGIAFVIWGIHKFDYPFLYDNQILAPFGYLLGAMLEFTVSIGLILLYFRKTRTALQRSLTTYETLFRSTKDGILMLNEKDFIVDSNDVCTSMFQYSKEELNGMHVTELMPPAERELFSSRKAVILRDGFIRAEVLYRKKDGTDMSVDITSTKVALPEGTFLFALLRDITQRKEVEKRLAVYTEQLETQVNIEIDKRMKHEQLLIHQSRMAMMGEMMSAIAHQWKQPLNTLSLLLQDMKDVCESSHPDINEVKESTLLSLLQVDYMTHTVEDFRNFYTSSKEMRAFPLHEAILGTVKLVFPQMVNHNISIGIAELPKTYPQNIPPSLPPDCETITCITPADKHRSYEPANSVYLTAGAMNEFRQALMSLVSNAKDAIIQYRQKNSLATMQGTIIFLLGEDEDFVYLHVSDNGGGIPADVLPRIFEPYFTTKSKEKGTGIGLYMTKTIIEESMKGEISVQNLSNGACFSIRLKRFYLY